MAPSEPYVRGDLTIDYVQRLVSLAGNPVRLTAVEYDLLRELSIHAGRVLTPPALAANGCGARPRQQPPR